MSLHKSLKSSGKLVRTRSVLTRTERLETLIREGRWSQDDDSPYGLPKVKIVKMKKRGKEPKKADEKEGEEEAQTS